ncbi:methylthioribulose 1-phosphate dehydratase [Marinobacter zhanjiangensis]|uniref:Methylthioribulose-1-phosphate dehydratase n=1 Tax=Marinobacter zhanjiangensis TaxID=578215 RepID=A0ABQ3AQN2_9GAMM|nr:methylthioribulose 1-phosphate dehydratase [Marinobacter zhanjiangensis]GGY64807.1 methylthioribulose-1-phosphate dehydratase [Marinobacter zhanjiangensis]
MTGSFDVTRYSRAAGEICRAGQFLYQRGWSPATSSNYSSRVSDRHVAITVSGRRKGQLTGADIMVVDLDGSPVQSDCRPSAETLLHTVIYRDRPDIGAVLHTHSVKATVLSRLVAEGEAVVLEDYELQKAFAGVDTHEGRVTVPVFANTQDMTSLAADTSRWLADNPGQPGYLIRGHGLYTWGRDMPECLRHVEAFEFLFECELETMRVRG